MALAPTLNSIEALYRKLERELYRAYHCRDSIHKADHFFNFCVTAHSMRDYYLERVGNHNNNQQTLNDNWSKETLLIIVSDIANSAKHFTLRDRKTHQPKATRTKKVKLEKSTFVGVYVNHDGGVFTLPVIAPDIVITGKDNNRYDLYEFMSGVTNYWREFLLDNGIKIRRQSVTQLIGKKR